MSQQLQDIIERDPDWRQVALAMIAYRVSSDQCFSSGELARELRIYRPELVFGVSELGVFVREQHAAHALSSYDNGFDEVYPVSVVRTTGGHGRTPAGIEVVVYGADRTEAQHHDFEVDIPPPSRPGRAWGG
jgi:hypothetical protein